jgi:O-antigen/teichoic acid export membrane protein
MQTEGLRRHRFVLRYITLLGGETFSKVCVLLAFAYLARTLGPHEFGVVEFALSLTVFFVLGAETGLGTYCARVVEQSPERAPSLIARVIVLRTLLGVPAYAAIMAISLHYHLPGTRLVAIYGVLVLLTPFFTQWLFQGLRQMQWVAAGSVLRYGTFTALVFLLVRPRTDTRVVAIAEIGGALAAIFFNTYIIKCVLRVTLDWRGAWRGAIDLFREVWFLGVSDLSWAAMWYSPAVLTGWLASGQTERVAWLSAAIRIVMSLHTFVWLYFFNMVPNLAKELKDGLPGWRRLIHGSLSTSMWAACFVALGGTLFAPVLIAVVYGSQYGPTVMPFQIVIWMIPVAWFSGHFRFSLIAAGQQHLEFAASIISGLSTAALAYYGVVHFGNAGAAAALLLGGVINAVTAWGLTHRAIGGVRFGAAALPFVTSIALAVIAASAASFPARASVAIAVCVAYAAIAVTQSNWRLAWEGLVNNAVR